MSTLSTDCYLCEAIKYKVDSFRIANHSDIEDIVQLVNVAYRPNSNIAGWTHEADLVSGKRINTEKLTDILSKLDVVILVATKNLTIVVCVEVEKQGNSSHIGMLAVNPKLQSQGVGKQMLEYAENYARLNFNANKFVMMVLSSRPELIDFYLKCGYQKSGSVIDYPISAGVGIPKQTNLKLEFLEKRSSQTV